MGSFHLHSSLHSLALGPRLIASCCARIRYSSGWQGKCKADIEVRAIAFIKLLIADPSEQNKEVSHVSEPIQIDHL